MERLPKTVDRAIARMRHMRTLLQRLQKEQSKLKADLKKEDAAYAQKLRDLQIELTPMVDCIQTTMPSFLEGMDPSVYHEHEAEIKKTLLSLESGLSNMYLFVRARNGGNSLLRESHDKKNIFFEERVVINPFDAVFQNVDIADTPGLENFRAFQPKLVKDI